MKNLAMEMVRDARDRPPRFWEVLAIAVAATTCAAFATALTGWSVFSLLVYTVVVGILFVSLNVVYMLGHVHAYSEMIRQRLDTIAEMRRINGPS